MAQIRARRPVKFRAVIGAITTWPSRREFEDSRVWQLQWKGAHTRAEALGYCRGWHSSVSRVLHGKYLRAGGLRSLWERFSGYEDRISSCEDRFSNREDDISNREDRISSREDRSASREDDISTREDRISSHEDRISTREDDISSREDDISSREDRFSSREDRSGTM